jgi:MFS family permease
MVRRGISDGPLRVGIIGAAGMLVSATAYPLTDSALIAVAWLVVVNFFAAFPWGAASAAAAELVPSTMRAQGTAFFYLILNLISFALGPWVVAAITDHVFGDKAALGYSLAAVNLFGMIGAIVLFVFGLSAYRTTLEQRDSWRRGPASTV